MQFGTHIGHGFSISLPHLFKSSAPFVGHEQYETVAFGSASLPTWSLGEGPAVILVHDRAGLADDMHPLAEALAAHGYRTIQFEVPSASEPLQGVAHLAELADEIIAVAHAFGPVAAIVAHGEGASAALVALNRERFTHNAVLIGADAMNDLSPDLPGNLGEVRSLLIHSQDDGVVPLHDALELAVAWPNCILSRVERLGHRRILSSPSTHAEVLRFLDNAGAAGALQ